VEETAPKKRRFSHRFSQSLKKKEEKKSTLSGESNEIIEEIELEEFNQQSQIEVGLVSNK